MRNKPDLKTHDVRKLKRPEIPTCVWSNGTFVCSYGPIRMFKRPYRYTKPYVLTCHVYLGANDAFLLSKILINAFI